MKNRGFAALFIVTLIALMSAVFTMHVATRTWSQSKGVFESQDVAQARFNAISCIYIAQLKIYLYENPIDGRYDLEGGECEIQAVDYSPTEIQLTVRAAKNDAEVIFDAKINPDSFKVLSLKEY